MTESVMRIAWKVGAVLVVGAAALAFVSPGAALTLFLATVAYFMLSNYTAYRVGAHNYRVGPATAVYGCLAASLLTLVAAASALFR